MSAYGLTQEQSEKLIVKTALENGVSNPRQIAYMLASAQHETDQFNTSREYGGRSQAIANGYSGGENYYGRGYVQTTHDYNYEKMDKALGLNGALIKNPELAATNPEIGAKLLVIGMKQGLYTGVGVGDYITDSSTDYVNARRVVNGTDKANLIAGYADKYDDKVQGIIDAVKKDGVDLSRAVPTAAQNGNAMADGVLRNGEQGPAVLQLQQQLNKAGFKTDEDSKFGPNTEKSVAEFQAKNGLDPDGVAGSKTLAKLNELAPVVGPAVPAATTPTTSTPAATQTSENGTWPVAGRKINAADKEGEGEGIYGSDRAGGARKHQGVDIEGNVGDRVGSFAPGTVLAAGPRGGYGNTVIVQHDDGRMTLYAHLDGINVKEGQKVGQNEQLGTMGRTGNTPSAGDTHLHFEMIEGSKKGDIYSGTTVDPMKYLNSLGQNQSTGSTSPSQSNSAALLREGDNGAQVKQLQEQLNKLGNYGLDADGKFGTKTHQAVEAFQKANGLDVDGIAGPRTLAKANELASPTQAATNNVDARDRGPGSPAGVVREGDQGLQVKQLQEQLNKAGNAGLTTNGFFDSKTEQALMTFQAKNGLDADGVAGPKTFAKLNEMVPQVGPPAPNTAAAEKLSMPMTATQKLMDSDQFKAIDALASKLPAGTFKNEQQRLDTVGSIMYEANATGMKVEKLEVNPDGTKIRASQGDHNTTGDRFVVTKGGEPLAQNAELMAKEYPKALEPAAKVVDAPKQTDEPKQPEAKKPILIA